MNKIKISSIITNLFKFWKGTHYYSQNGEDFLLWKFFKKKKKGFYIDIGAFDGKYLSNSYFFENSGWDGICIEPNPVSFELLVNNRKNSLNLNYACIDNEELKLVTLNVDDMGYLSTIDNSEEKKQDIIRRYKKRGFFFDGLNKVSVEAVTLNSVLKKYKINKKIDFLKIDVEGAELMVLKGFDIKKFQPNVIMLEANTIDDEKKLKDYLEIRNYFYVGRLVENIFFVKDKNDKLKMKNINIKCIIKKQIHPIDPKFSIKDLKEGRKINTSIKNN